MKRLLNFKLELIVFICGAGVMILEMLGSRILAPYVGTSIFVWTSLIGIILGALSLGYFWGGKIADRYPNYRTFSAFIFMAGAWIAGLAMFKNFVLQAFSGFGIRTGSILSATALFAVPSVLLGMVSPFAARLKIEKIKTSGKTVGNLYALSTLGSIFGTFLAGFYLIPHFKLSDTLFVLGAALSAASLLGYAGELLAAKSILITFSLLGTVLPLTLERVVIYEGDSAYSHITIYDTQRLDEDREIRLLDLDTLPSSAIYKNDGRNAFDYAKMYELDQVFKPKIKKALMIGGGAYVAPREFLYRYPNAAIDVVEIDPKLLELSQEYFRLETDLRMRIIHEDGRTFLNRNDQKYDVIYGDAFSSYFSIPFHLTTREAAQLTYDSLVDDGTALINIVSALSGENSRFLRAELATYESVFPNVYLFPMKEWENPDSTLVQNIALVATKSTRQVLTALEAPESSESPPGSRSSNLLSRLWKYEFDDSDAPLLTDILTDEHAPVEHYVLGFTKKNRR